MNENNYPLQNMKQTATTTIFETKEQRKVASEEEVQAQTLLIEFDFTNVTTDEILIFLTSSTSCMKMFQNNITKFWNNETTKQAVKNGVYQCNVRDLLDNRKRSESTPDQLAQRTINTWMKKGLTPEQMIAKLQALTK